MLGRTGELMSVRMHEWPRRHRITVEHYYRMAACDSAVA
jgi:hypothetical protein